MKKHKIKSLLLLLLFCSCGTEYDKYREAPAIYYVGSWASDLKIYNIDSCEYIGKLLGLQSDVLCHKGNCKNPIHCYNK